MHISPLHNLSSLRQAVVHSLHLAAEVNHQIWMDEPSQRPFGGHRNLQHGRRHRPEWSPQRAILGDKPATPASPAKTGRIMTMCIIAQWQHRPPRPRWSRPTSVVKPTAPCLATPDQHGYQARRPEQDVEEQSTTRPWSSASKYGH